MSETMRSDFFDIKFNLDRWQYYQEHRYYLEESEKEKIKAFFNDLNAISLDDRKFKIM